MIIQGLDKKGNIRRIETGQEIFYIGKSIWDALEGKTDLNIDDPKDYMRGLEYYYIDGIPAAKEEAENLFEDIKNLDPKMWVG